MATLNIGGKRVKVDDAFLSMTPEQQQQTVEEIAGQLGISAQPDVGGEIAKASADFTQGANYDPEQIKAGMDPNRQKDAAERYKMQMDGYTDRFGGPAGRFGALTEGSEAGIMAGFDDEIGAGMMAPVEAAKDWFKGEGFDMGRAYDRGQKERDLRKQMRREEHPVASIAGEVAGGLALPGMVRGMPTAAVPAASRMPTLFGKVPGVVAAPVEGAAYGAAYGAGEAKPGERTQGALEGGAIGAAAGTLLHGAGAGVAKLRAKPSAAPSAANVADEAQQLYRASEAQGVVFKAQPVDRLKTNLKFLAGEINEKLRPVTAGTVDDVEKLVTGPMTLEKFDEFRQGINLDLRKAQGNDKRILKRMKEYLDTFADNLGAGDMTGGPDGVKLLGEARKLWAQSKKAEVIERIMDQAGVDGAGKYTQSGFANAVRREMNTLYKSIRKGKTHGWTKEEVALIKQMASGGSNSRMVNWMAKFSPRGPMSIVLGQMLGSTMPGVGNVAVPLAGHVTGQIADRQALAAAERIRSGAATGSLPALPRLPNWLDPFIPGAASASTGILPSPNR